MSEGTAANRFPTKSSNKNCKKNSLQTRAWVAPAQNSVQINCRRATHSDFAWMATRHRHSAMKGTHTAASMLPQPARGEGGASGAIASCAYGLNRLAIAACVCALGGR